MLKTTRHMSDLKQIARPIGAADMEFYYGGIVRRMALVLSGFDDTEWNRAGTDTRIKWLNLAAKSCCELFNDSNVVDRLPLLLKNLQTRT